MDGPSTPPYAFGDLLALARLSWLREMSRRLDALGFDRFKRGDSAVMRLLSDGPVPLGMVGASLGVTRQAARKVVDRLERDGLVQTERNTDDARVIMVVTTSLGDRYSRALTQVTGALNRELTERVDRAQLVAADAVLRASITDPVVGESMDALVPRLP